MHTHTHTQAYTHKPMAPTHTTPPYEDVFELLMTGNPEGKLKDAIWEEVEKRRLDYSPMDLETLEYLVRYDTMSCVYRATCTVLTDGVHLCTQERKEICIQQFGCADGDKMKDIQVPECRMAQFRVQAAASALKERERCKRLARRIADPATGLYKRFAGLPDEEEGVTGL